MALRVLSSWDGVVFSWRIWFCFFASRWHGWHAIINRKFVNIPWRSATLRTSKPLRTNPNSAVWHTLDCTESLLQKHKYHSVVQKLSCWSLWCAESCSEKISSVQSRNCHSLCQTLYLRNSVSGVEQDFFLKKGASHIDFLWWRFDSGDAIYTVLTKELSGCEDDGQEERKGVTCDWGGERVCVSGGVYWVQCYGPAAFACRNIWLCSANHEDFIQHILILPPAG